LAPVAERTAMVRLLAWIVWVELTTARAVTGVPALTDGELSVKESTVTGEAWR
jgi:hypothetical protein